MPSNFSIEVAAAPDTTTTDRGRVLAKFAQRFLETQNYKVTEEVRLTGTEVDLLATELSTGERIFVECKAHRSTISSEVLYKILGNVTARNFSSGWLISTYSLGKDAKGVRHEWEQRPTEERRRLQIYEPADLVRRLIAATVVIEPSYLERPIGLRFSDAVYLLLSPIGEFWALLVLDQTTGIREAAILYDARTGARITADYVLDTIAGTDTTLAPLNWLAGAREQQDEDVERLHRELQSIVQVPIAEHWADYRPARPQDFVGRDQLQKDVFEFFSHIRSSQSRTRLFAIKAPSGWGKSSCVLKIAARAHNHRHRPRTFVFAVDSRAASSKRFGELALFTAVREAIKAKFVEHPEEFTFGGADNPFSTDTMKSILGALKQQDKLICLIFDQFEELLYKAELEPVFDEIRSLCNAVDEAQENVVIGFSWKTDGTIPPEHKAYHLWHSLADRRLEFELTPFSINEVATALNRFAAELGQPLVPQLRRLLQDHCQGYPWLLKKLCIHILDLVRAGMDQSDVLVRSLSIQELFKKDIERLTSVEYACIKQISQESPAEFFKIINIYGDEVVNNLLDKRLIIRSGPRLSIYWDIFRDYVLTERVPYIPVTYIPQANLSSYMAGVKLLLRERQISYDDLAAELRIAKGTADNVVRDLVMIGHAEANRRSEAISALHENEEQAAQTLFSFCTSHVMYRNLISEVGPGGVFSEEAMRTMTRRILRAPSVSDNLLEHYRQKLLRWFMSIGLIERYGRDFILTNRSASLEFLDPGRYLRRGSNLFFGEAPPRKAVAALEFALQSRPTRESLESSHGRNTLSCLINLEILDSQGNVILQGPPASAEAIIRDAANRSTTVVFVEEMLRNAPNLTAVDVGRAVAEKFGLAWSVGSQKRCGGALRLWALWSRGQTQIGTRRRRKTKDNRAQSSLPGLFPSSAR
ncbi:MAG: restriction endonuclease [Alphaproteobacteria bacterium]